MGVGYKIKDGRLTDTVGIVMFVTKKPSNEMLPRQQIEPVPKEIEGITTDIIEIPGGFRPRADDSRHRPFSGGVAMIHYKTPGTGTLGLIVQRTKGPSKKLYGLTNNHVGANEDVKDLNPPPAKRKDSWIQPGAHGGGRAPKDVIAGLYMWNKLIPSAPGSINYYDAAIGMIINNSLPDAKAYEMMDVGKVKGMEDNNLGDKVMKRGRTTLKTIGMVYALIPPPQTIQVPYRGYPCDFTDQVVIVGDPPSEPFSLPGDSGSVIVSTNKDSTGSHKAKALLFAGGEGSDGIDYTIASPIKKVAKDFNLKF